METGGSRLYLRFGRPQGTEMRSHQLVILRLPGPELLIILCEFTEPAFSRRRSPNTHGEYNSKKDHLDHEHRHHPRDHNNNHGHNHDHDLTLTTYPSPKVKRVLVTLYLRSRYRTNGCISSPSPYAESAGKAVLARPQEDSRRSLRGSYLENRKVES